MLTLADSGLSARAAPWLVPVCKSRVSGMMFTDKSAEDRLRRSCGYNVLHGQHKALSQFFDTHSPHICYIVKVVLMKENSIEEPFFILVVVVLFSEVAVQKNTEKKGLLIVSCSW